MWRVLIDPNKSPWILWESMDPVGLAVRWGVADGTRTRSVSVGG